MTFIPGAPRRSYRSYWLLLLWTALTFVVVGRTLSSDPLFLIVEALLAIGLMYAGWKWRSPKTAAALAAWQLLFAANGLYSAVTDPRGFRFHGDALGVDISLTWIAPTLATVFAIVAIWWIREFSKRPFGSRR